jgi:hypothetical protein
MDAAYNTPPPTYVQIFDREAQVDREEDASDDDEGHKRVSGIRSAVHFSGC